MSYRSQHRLSKNGAACQVITYKEKKPQKQPTELSKTITIAERLLKQIQANAPVKDPNIEKMMDWLDNNHHPVVPEHTSHPNEKPVTDLGVVLCYHGNDAQRIAACNRALPRLLKANPQPAGFFIVEALEDHQISNLNKYKDNPQVTIINAKIKDKNKALFQKEALWTIGTRKAFENPSITKVVAIDADSAFDDNSWAYVISQALEYNDFIQPFIGMNYSEQKDGPAQVLVGEAYAYITKYKGKRNVAPGGSFACTKKLFQEIFNNQWPYRPLGAGDVATWAFILGNRTESAKKPSNIEDSIILDEGLCPNIHVHYANLLLNHYYHGPLVNRMYGTRNYLAKKYNNPETTFIDKQGLLSWSDTTDGQIFQESFTMLKAQTKNYLSVNRLFTIKDTKAMTKLIAGRYYGVIDGALNRLIITTVYRSGYDKSPLIIKNLYNDLKLHCKNLFTFVVFTDTDLQISGIEQYPLNLNYIDAPNMWRRMSIFQKEYRSTDNVLFIDPSTSIINDFTMLNCSSGHMYFARHDSGRWSSSMMYFKNVPRIWEQYKEESEAKTTLKPEYIYLDPATYLLANWHDKEVIFKNLIIHADYKFEKEREASPVNDFILK